MSEDYFGSSGGSETPPAPVAPPPAQPPVAPPPAAPAPVQPPVAPPPAQPPAAPPPAAPAPVQPTYAPPPAQSSVPPPAPPPAPAPPSYAVPPSESTTAPAQPPFAYVASAPVPPVASESELRLSDFGPTGSSATTIAVAPSMLAAWGGALCGVFLCLGAWSSWISISGLGQSINFGGMHSGMGLHGTWVLIIGALVLALSVALAVVPHERQVKQSAAAAVTVLGVVALGIVVQQFVHVSNGASAVNGVFSNVVNIHVGVGWGLWQCGLASAGAIAAGVCAYLL